MSSNEDMGSFGSDSEGDLEQPPTVASLGEPPNLKPPSGRRAIYDAHVTRGRTVAGKRLHRECKCNYCGHSWNSRILTDVSEHLLQCKKLKLQPVQWAKVQILVKEAKAGKKRKTSRKHSVQTTLTGSGCVRASDAYM